MKHARLDLSASGAERSFVLISWGTLDFRDEPVTKVRHRRDFDSQVVANRPGYGSRKRYPM
jgi:hypothetical protein